MCKYTYSTMKWTKVSLVSADRGGGGGWLWVSASSPPFAKLFPEFSLSIKFLAASIWDMSIQIVLIFNYWPSTKILTSHAVRYTFVKEGGLHKQSTGFNHNPLRLTSEARQCGWHAYTTHRADLWWTLHQSITGGTQPNTVFSNYGLPTAPSSGLCICTP